ncbi:DUF2034 domain-containing protein [Azoarcus sp. PA01]|nr:DUF2034 domain-containing protein [Azoarcus sp. PA01]
MGRRRYRNRNEGLLDIAVRSDWKVSAGLAAASVFGGAVLVPAFLGSSPVLRPIGTVFTPLAWLVAFVFAFIAVIRFVKQAPTAGAGIAFQRSASTPCSVGAERPSATGRREPAASAHPATPPSTQDNVWIPSVVPGVPPRPPRPESWSLDVLDRVEWKRFEDLCCAFYREKGIRAETTRLGVDGGIDIHLFQDDADPTHATAIVQCKAWNKPVGVKEVRELRGVMAHEKVDKAFFMAPNGYTDDARAFATENRIMLLDGKLFLAMLQRLPEDASRRPLEFATAGDWTTPTCPSCGDRMTARDSKRGAFWGCVTYPKCKGKLPMRASARP